jgi:hypothetical protein
VEGVEILAQMGGISACKEVGTLLYAVMDLEELECVGGRVILKWAWKKLVNLSGPGLGCTASILQFSRTNAGGTLFYELYLVNDTNVNDYMREGDKDTKGIREKVERTKDVGTKDMITGWISAGLFH